MPQSLTQLPETASFEIGGCHVKIDDHKVVDWFLFVYVWSIINEVDSDLQTLTEFEKHGISFESLIEYCVHELECKEYALTKLIWHNDLGECSMKDSVAGIWETNHNYSKSVEGRNIAEQLVEKIRSCDDWNELYEEIHWKSKFHKYMKSKIIKELEQCLRV